LQLARRNESIGIKWRPAQSCGGVAEAYQRLAANRQLAKRKLKKRKKLKAGGEMVAMKYQRDGVK
jgi:hypothetical protein